MTEPAQKTIVVNGVELCYFERGTPGAGRPTVLLVHATGFHARCWDMTAAELGDLHSIAVDMRGHGRSGKAPPLSWDTFGADLSAFIEAVDLRHIVAAGHSMGGHCVVQAAAAHAGRFRSLVLVDPVILPPDAYRAWQPSAPEDHPVARRRNQFDGPLALRAQLEGRGGFRNWLPEALADYCEYGLLANPDGEGMVLACPPIVEATIYTGSAGTDVMDLVRSIEAPVTVLRAEPRNPEETVMDFSKSPTWPELASEFPNATDEYHPELSHFIPMEAPGLVAEHILNYARG